MNSIGARNMMLRFGIAFIRRCNDWLHSTFIQFVANEKKQKKIINWHFERLTKFMSNAADLIDILKPPVYFRTNPFVCLLID